MGNSASVADKNNKCGNSNKAASTVSMFASFVNPNKKTKEQLKNDKLCRERQSKSVEYVVSHLYYSMPVNISSLDGSDIDRKVPFIEIDHKRAQEMLEIEERREDTNRGIVKRKIESPLKALRKTYPESVTVKENGDIEIEHFQDKDEESEDPEKELTPLSPMRSHTIPFEALSNLDVLPKIMEPPRFKNASMTRIDIEWDEPQYEQLVERHEVQYRLAVQGSATSSPNWRALCTKNRLLGHLPTAFLGDLKPATKVVFRIRQGSPAGWSDWSAESPAYATRAGRPSQMNPPFASNVGTDLLMLHWTEPSGNGASITGYTLRGKRPGEEMNIAYMGVLDNYVITSIGREPVEPGHIYSFDVCAHNEIGQSSWSEPATFMTLKDRGQKLTEVELPENALRSHKNWLECWDAATEQVFYFNKITGARTTERPVEFNATEGSSQSRESEDTIQAENEPGIAFRVRRYRFLRKLYKSTGNATGPGQLRGSPGRRARQQSDAFRLKINVSRESIYDDTFEQFRFLGPHDLVRKPKVHFEGEEGIDSGGLTKDWYLSMSKAITAMGMFKQVDGDGVELEINPEWRGLSNDSTSNDKRNGEAPLQRMNSSKINIPEEALAHYCFVGKMIGKAIYDRHNMLLPMNRAFYKILRNDPLNIDDLKQIDPALHKSLTWMLQNSIEGVLYETFSISQTADDGTVEDIDLCEKGRTRDVTDENKAEYVDLLSKYRLQFGAVQQMEAIVDGISASVPLTMLQEFKIDEIELLLNGKEDIDIDEIRAYTIFQGKYDEQHRIVLWLWQILRESDLKERSLFLTFVTGSPRLPLDGFEPPFNVTEGEDMDPLHALPTAHTCFNQLVVPRYGDLATFKEKLKYAIQNSIGFQMT